MHHLSDVVTYLLFICTLAVALPWFRRVMVVRRTNRIQQRPILVETREDQVPPELAAVLAAGAPALRKLGFEPVASVHAPSFGSALTWTQVLFIRKDSGDRASVLMVGRTPKFAHLGPLRPLFIFATESPDGRTVKTPVEDSGLLETKVIEMFEKHRRDVVATFGSELRGVVPSAEAARPWLQDRAEMMAAQIAKKESFKLDRTAKLYRPSWSLAARTAWKMLWAKKRRVPKGFEIVPNSPVKASAQSFPATPGSSES
jgi:hypothetical protein